MIEATVLNSNFSDLLRDSDIPGKVLARITKAVKTLLPNKELSEITVMNVVQLDPWAVSRLRGVGHKSITSLEDFLRMYGLHLGMSEAQVFKSSTIDNDQTHAIVERTILAIEKLCPFIRISETDRVRVKAIVCEGNEEQ